MLFTRKRKSTYVSTIPPAGLTLNSGQLVFVKSCRYLGVTMDAWLTWAEHITAKIGQVKRTLHMIKPSISKMWGPKPDLMRWCWMAVARPSFTYGAFLWGQSVQKSHRSKLNTLQRQAMLQLGHFRRGSPHSGTGGDHEI
jgi:hypothetical protein